MTTLNNDSSHDQSIYESIYAYQRSVNERLMQAVKLNNDELREEVSRMIIECRSQDGQIDEWGERELRDDIVQLIAAHDQQLLEAILEGIVDEVAIPPHKYDTKQNWQFLENMKSIRNQRNEEIRQHIKSVFKKEGE